MAVLALCAAAAAGSDALAADATPRAGLGHSVETLRFAKHRAPVRVIRGAAQIRPAVTGKREIVSFGTGFADQVIVVRGYPGAAAIAAIGPGKQTRIEKVSFAQAGLPVVTVLRGLAARELGSRDMFSVDLFGPASEGELGRIAFAVDGVESRHGGDPRMWRPQLDGPQGPMQVSAAAALDVGGGNRFDLHENRMLGRAYLAQMYRRYGNWTDAVAAYNWGPGNLDQWIAGGRNFDRMPLETQRYIELVLRGALMSRHSAGL